VLPLPGEVERREASPISEVDICAGRDQGLYAREVAVECRVMEIGSTSPIQIPTHGSNPRSNRAHLPPTGRSAERS